MGERWYLRTMSAIGPMYYADADNMGELWSSTREGGTACDDLASIRGLRAALCSESGRDCSAVRIVRVGPPRRYTLTEKGRAATEPARQGVDGTTDGCEGVQPPAARPEAVCGPMGNGGTLLKPHQCPRSSLTGREHVYGWESDRLVCQFCGRRAE